MTSLKPTSLIMTLARIRRGHDLQGCSEMDKRSLVSPTTRPVKGFMDKTYTKALQHRTVTHQGKRPGAAALSLA